MASDRDQEIENWVRESDDRLDYLDFATSRLTLPDWLAVARLFRPEFVEVSGCVLWKRSYSPENFREWYANLNGDPTSIEGVLNEVRLWQFVEIREGNSQDEEGVRSLAHDIAFFWRTSLAHDFPERQFDVTVTETDDGPAVNCVVRRGLPSNGIQ